MERGSKAEKLKQKFQRKMVPDRGPHSEGSGLSSSTWGSNRKAAERRVERPRSEETVVHTIWRYEGEDPTVEHMLKYWTECAEHRIEASGEFLELRQSRW